jgi:hypothetical protein
MSVPVRASLIVTDEAPKAKGIYRSGSFLSEKKEGEARFSQFAGRARRASRTGRDRLKLSCGKDHLVVPFFRRIPPGCDIQ